MSVRVDLRSDTVTKPTPEMRQAMYEAEVGDDSRGEDPTVQRLEALAAQLLGKAAGVLVASGTMGNLVAVLAHCSRGDEVIVGQTSHIFRSESGGISALGGIHVRTVPDAAGFPSEADVASAIRGKDGGFPNSRLLCLENTHNRASGSVISPTQTARLTKVARSGSMATHLDGARIFNAAVALNVPAADLAVGMDSVTFCLSKGLAAPVGSLVCADRETIRRIRAYRKMVGGSMRQAGVIAAAGIVALQTMVTRLSDDHLRARQLADGLAQIDGLRVAANRVQTNIVIFDVLRLGAHRLVEQLAGRGIWCSAVGEGSIRMVTHREIDAIAIEKALAIVSDVMRAELTGR